MSPAVANRTDQPGREAKEDTVMIHADNEAFWQSEIIISVWDSLPVDDFVEVEESREDPFCRAAGPAWA